MKVLEVSKSTTQLTELIMAYVKTDDVVIPVFDGSDYGNWRKCMLKFLQYKKCKLVVDRSKWSIDGGSISRGFKC